MDLFDIKGLSGVDVSMISIDLDLELLLSYALSAHPLLVPLIDKRFSELSLTLDRQIFTKRACDLFDSLPLTHSSSAYKMASILFHEGDSGEKVSESAIQFISRAYKLSYKVAMSCKEYADLDSFNKQFRTKFPDADKFNENDLIRHLACFTYITHYKGLELAGHERLATHFVSLLQTIQMGRNVLKDLPATMVSDRNKSDVVKLLMDRYWGKRKSSVNLLLYFETMSDNLSPEIRAVRSLLTNWLGMDSQEVVKATQQKTPTKSRGIFGVVMQNMGLNDRVIFESFLVTRQIVQEIVCLLISDSLEDLSSFSADSIDETFTACLILAACGKSHLEDIEFYFKSKPVVKISTARDDLLSQLKEAETNYVSLAKQHKSDLTVRDKQIKDLQEYCSKLEKQQFNYEKLQAELVLKDKELLELKEMVARWETQLVDSEVSYEDMLSYISQFKIAVVGGHFNWGKKISEQLGVESFPMVENRLVNIGRVSSADYVFYCWNHSKHRYEKELTSKLGGRKYEYLPPTVNVEMVLSSIYQIIKEKQTNS